MSVKAVTVSPSDGDSIVTMGASTSFGSVTLRKDSKLVITPSSSRLTETVQNFVST